MKQPCEVYIVCPLCGNEFIVSQSNVSHCLEKEKDEDEDVLPPVWKTERMAELGKIINGIQEP